MAATGFFSALFTGAVLAVLGLLFIRPLARLLGSTETILPYAVDYMRFILLGTPFMMASLVLNNQLRFQGSAIYAMVGIASGAVLNIGLDPLLIFGLHMGIAGAAIATITSQLVGFILLLVGTSKGGNLRVRFRNFTPKAEYPAAIVNGGMPSLCRQGLNSVGTICLNQGAGVYGDAAIAAMSIVGRIVMFANSCVIGFGQGFQPVCGFNYGAKLKSRVREGFPVLRKVRNDLSDACGILCVIFAPHIVRFFRDDLEKSFSSVDRARWQACVCP